MGDELRACPFVQCGGKAQAVFASPSGAYVQCTECETTTRVIDENMTEAENMASAVALWNSRAPTRPAERDAEGWVLVPRGDLEVLAGMRKHIHQHEPDRVKWEGQWHYGPLATAYITTIEAVASAADKMLSALPTSAQDSAEEPQP